MFSRWETDDPAKTGGWHPVPQPIHAWADVRADARGAVDMRRFQVATGTYRGADPYGLMWSGRKSSDPILADVAVRGFDVTGMRDGESRIVVTQGDQIVALAALGSAAPPGLNVQVVALDALNGVYAAPADGRRHPAVILLHGSEGGDRDGARALAQRFAGQGFAAFALNYFAWDLKGLVGVPNTHVNQPIELLTRVADPLAAAAARIPVESSKARFLWLGAGRDET